ncbi:MAG: MBOAT family protein [Methylophilaceae bacterium]
MLFNSYVFIFAFTPIVFFGFFYFGKKSHALASLWLAAASLFFYGWWDIRYVGLLLCSILINYSVSYLIANWLSYKPTRQSKILLQAAIIANLILLGYYKYANFFLSNVNNLAGTSFPIGEIILPLGVSFFTFTQIAFLVDTYQGKVKNSSFVNYTLFVTYFPHLIAGPVLHHKEMMPQFAKSTVCHINWENIALGISIFMLGLAKKVLIADSLGDISTPIFSALEAGSHPMLIEAWVGALSYTLQLYFDFSAYSDMAIGISLIFNVRLPMNFYSPYKSTSIIDFWRRWHITLSRLLRDYLYIPLGGSRNGKARRYLNLMITMLLGGLWHGAGWTFVVWGGLHGFYLVLNHSWRTFKEKMHWGNGGKLLQLGAGLLTFLAVVVGWVFFKSDTVLSAITMLKGMVGMNGITLPLSLSSKFYDLFGQIDGVVFNGLWPLYTFKALAVLGIGFTIVWLMPNLLEIFKEYHPVCDDMKTFEKIHSDKAHTHKDINVIQQLTQWQPTKIWATAISFIMILSLLLLNRTSVFLYFQF